MKFYVASKFENKAEVKALIAVLQSYGHSITFDWTDHELDSTWSPTDQLRYLRQSAIDDVEGVINCDALILICRPSMKGAFVELGVAISLNKRIYIVGRGPDSENVFFNAPGARHFKTSSDLLASGYIEPVALAPPAGPIKRSPPVISR